MVLQTCTRRGCGKQFDPSENDGAGCSFHPGAPTFHEGLKSWSCCSGTSKPVLTFDEFLAIPGCATGTHSTEKPVSPPKPASSSADTSITPVKSDSNGVETYSAPLPPAPTASTSNLKDAVKPKSTAYVEEQDDPDAPIPAEARCKRKACGATWSGKREPDECTYHPGHPIFHEGSKGYSCCKPRVLDFDDFMKIKGCKTGQHLFVGPKKVDSAEEELVQLRTDHYQTPRQVIVSIFGKNLSKEESGVVFERESMHVDFKLPDNKRFKKTFELYGPIDAQGSTFRFTPAKAEVTLAKADARSWPSIVKLTDDVASSNFVPQLAFSAGGGRGTVGSKEMVLDEFNRMRVASP